MNLSKKLVKLLSLGTLVIGILLTVILNTTGQNSVFADGSGSSSSCTESSDPANIDGSITGTASLVTKIAPSGKIITGVCIKSGSNMFGGNQHSGVLGNGTYENNCYVIAGVGTSVVTVTKIGTGSNCQGISHIDVIYGSTSTPTNDPTPTGVTPTGVTPTGVTPTGTTVTPTDTQDPTPTSFACPTGQTYDSGQRICIYIDCEGSGTCEVEIGKSPTPTATPTATATATPTPGSSNGGSSTVQSATGSSNGGSSSSPSVQAPVMAPTGTFGTLAGNASLLAGFLLTSLALPGYAKKKKN